MPSSPCCMAFTQISPIVDTLSFSLNISHTSPLFAISSDLRCMYVHMHALIINKPSFYPSIPCRSISIWFSPYIAQGRLDSSTFECLGLNTIEMCLCKHTYVQNYKGNTKIMLWNIWEQFNRTMLCVTKLISFFETKSHWTQSGTQISRMAHTVLRLPVYTAVPSSVWSWGANPWLWAR